MNIANPDQRPLRLRIAESEFARACRQFLQTMDKLKRKSK